ncbi:fungal-specific transcription factor domain-containing protein [Lipomyces arxii]|uniref:fungal-specific transcription factor domain-containing protein n=1 Tax=Lipomyces arxii TaxID=56418 RepID=UPI0034CFEB50
MSRDLHSGRRGSIKNREFVPITSAPPTNSQVQQGSQQGSQFSEQISIQTNTGSLNQLQSQHNYQPALLLSNSGASPQLQLSQQTRQQQQRDYEAPGSKDGPSGKSSIEHGLARFESSVPSKRKSARTGQACDRCKLRKIKCNATTGACTPCTLARVACTNTDLNSRRAVPRGYVETLEQEIASLKLRAEDLEFVLQKLAPSIDTANLPRLDQLDMFLQQQSAPVLPSIENLTSLKLPSKVQNESTSEQTRLPVFVSEPGAMSQHREGGTWDEGKLSIFGVTLNLRDLAPDDLGDVNFFEKFTSPKPAKVELPPYEEAKNYILTYINVVHPVTPVLSKSWLMQELERLYAGDGYVPTAQIIIIFNMIFALITSSMDLYHRKLDPNRENHKSMSARFYRRITPYFHDIFHQPDLTSVQALVLLLLFLRPSPRPQSSWVLGRMAMTVAIQLGLHRNQARANGSSWSLAVHETEMRKRVFWNLLSLETAISSRLGRPLALSQENFDTELPLAVDDEHLNGTDFSKIEDPCSFLPAIALFGLTRISVKVYSTFYAVSKPTADEYERLVVDFEHALATWKNQLPRNLDWTSSDSTGNLQDKRYAGIMWLTMNELHLFIRHPSGSTTTNTEFNDKSRDIAVDVSRELLRTMENLMKINYVESTWYNLSVLLTSLFTIFYDAWAKEEISAESVTAVKMDIEISLRVLDEIAFSLGTSADHNVMRQIVSKLASETVAKLEERLVRSSFVQQQPAPTVKVQQHVQVHRPPYHNEPTTHSLAELASAATASSASLSVSSPQIPYPPETYVSPSAPVTYAAQQPQAYSGYGATPPAYDSSDRQQPLDPAVLSRTMGQPYMYQPGISPQPNTLVRGNSTPVIYSSPMMSNQWSETSSATWRNYIFNEMQTLEKLSYIRKDPVGTPATAGMHSSPAVGSGTMPGPSQDSTNESDSTGRYNVVGTGSYYG